MNNDIVNSQSTNLDGDTKTFNKASDDYKALYDFSGGEEALFEFRRTASEAFAKAQKRMKWWSFTNTRLIVYIAFFFVLTVFSLYYTVNAEYFIAAFALIAAVFILYITLFGHKLFISGLEADEKNGGADICCKICSENIYLTVGSEYECIPIKQVSAVRCNKRFLLITFKNSKLCRDGLILESGGANFEEIKKHLALKKIK